MVDDSARQDTSQRLKSLIETDRLSEADRSVAAQCLRRLENPLRLTVFGTDPAHAAELVNLMVGQAVIPPDIPRGRIQVLNGPALVAQAHAADGTKHRVDGPDISAAFDGDPARVRVFADLPVLKKLSVLIAVDPDPARLIRDAAKTLPPADMTIWSGADLAPGMDEIWQAMPEALRDHSYLVLSPRMNFPSWDAIAPDFVDVLSVDPRRAQDAKSAAGGVDKAAFKAAGGTALVKAIKKELDILVQSASDAAQVLCARHAQEATDTSATAPANAGPDIGDAPAAADNHQAETAEPEAQFAEPQDADNDFFAKRTQTVPLRQQAYSVPLGKLASRSRLLNKAAQEGTGLLSQRTVSLALKNMPKSDNRTVSKSGPRPRIVSRRIRGSATPWSLDL